MLFLFVFCFHSVKLQSFNRKLEVIVDKAPVHLDPDRKSAVVATLKKGTLVSLGSERKFRKNWNYIYFTSERTGRTKSGYILDSVVKKLFEVTKKLTIQREGEDPRNRAGEKRHFRNARWGMNQAQVVRLEGSPNHRENSGGLDIFQYPQKVLDMDCMIGYVFADNKLAKAKYSFIAKFEDNNQYIREYEKIRDILVQKYGKPEAEMTLWRDKMYQDDRPSWGLALSQGHCEFNSQWQDSETAIQLRLYSGKERVFLVVMYSGLQYLELASKAKAQSRLSIW